MAKTKESILEEKVSKYMKSKRIWQLARFQAQSNQFGIPDRLYLYKGILLGLELKTKEGKATELQMRKLKEICYNGGIGVIIRSVEDLENLIRLIDKYVWEDRRLEETENVWKDFDEESQMRDNFHAIL